MVAKPGIPFAAVVLSGPAEIRLTLMPSFPRYLARYLAVASNAAFATPIQS